MPKVRNELRNIGQLYTAFFTDHQRYPKSVEEFKAYLKRDPGARDLYQALEEGFYVVVPTRNPSSSAILAYEKTPDQKGFHFVVKGDGAVDAMTTKELEKALQNPGG
jgi:hypothetical protein